MIEFMRRVNLSLSLISVFIFCFLLILFLGRNQSMAQGTILSGFNTLNAPKTTEAEIKEAIERKRALSTLRPGTTPLKSEAENKTLPSTSRTPAPTVASAIEKAFRIQYSELILRQLGQLELP